MRRHIHLFSTKYALTTTLCLDKPSYTHTTQTQTNSSIHERILIFTNTSTLSMCVLHSSIKKNMNSDISPPNIRCNLLSCPRFGPLTDWYHIQSTDWFSYLKISLSPQQCLSPHALRQTQQCHHKHLMEVAIVAQQMVLTVRVRTLAHVMANK